MLWGKYPFLSVKDYDKSSWLYITAVLAIFFLSLVQVLYIYASSSGYPDLLVIENSLLGFFLDHL